MMLFTKQDNNAYLAMLLATKLTRARSASFFEPPVFLYGSRQLAKVFLKPFANMVVLSISHKPQNLVVAS